MKSFFDAIIIITCFTVLILSYYLLKKCLALYRIKKTDKNYSTIIKNEHRAQNRRSLQVVLAKMKSDQAFWAEIYIRSVSGERFRLEHKPGSNEWSFLFGNRISNQSVKSEMEKFGNIIYTNEILTGIICYDSETLLNCILYFFDQVIHISESAHIILKY